MLTAKGMAAWASAWRSLPAPVARPVPGPPPALAGDNDELVRVLAAMALAHIHPDGEPSGPTAHNAQGVD
ncbi:hypothetical protein AB0D71_47620, partial [Streptomyces avermitilis]|uniref:hypothetical protein n=1 Tax=Streptomyces avermitilis TaxID=33903 RepID=UPI0033F90C73